MEIMIRRINKILLLVLISIFIGCKGKETSPVNDKNAKETITENVKLEDNSNYSIWYFSAQNIDKTYKNVAIYISNDSIKVMDGNLLKCKGEIVQEKSTFTDYFKSQKNGAEIKKKLKSDYGLNISDDITVVMNANGDISQEGCLFPFNDIFIIDNHLFYYDKGYHCFVQNKEKQLVTDPKINSYIEKSDVQLPYDKKIDLSNVKYNRVKADKISGLDDFSCGEEEARYIPLLSKNNIDLILVPQDCADFPYRFYLLSIIENKIISNLYVEGEFFEPEDFNNKTFTSFKIDDKQLIQVKTIEKNKEKIKSEKVINYIVNESGKILKI
jgi:hypothetical protein